MFAANSAALARAPACAQRDGSGSLQTRARRQPQAQPVLALLGGRGDRPYGASRGGGGGGGLIMPGGSMPRKLQDELAGAGGILDPSGGPQGRGNITGKPPPIVGGGLEMPGQAAPTHNKFKPPPGFAQENTQAWTQLDAQFKSMDPNQLLDMLSTKAGFWHTLAKVIPILNREGFDTKLLEDITGIDSRTQNQWMMSASVYDSLAMDPEVSEAEVKYFNDMDKGPVMLSELRFVGLDEQRVPTVKYMVGCAFGADEALTLARAVKDYERRSNDEVQGFAFTPADCLALRYFRDAVEQEKNELAFRNFSQKALSVVGISNSARKRVERLIAGHGRGDVVFQQTSMEASPAIEYIRFTDNEVGYRPIAIVGTYGQASVADVARVSTAATDTQFGFFSETGAGHTWMVMPTWRAVSFSKVPYGIYIPEVMDVAILAKDVQVGEDHEMQRNGPAVLLIEKNFKAISPICWYILPGATGAVEMVPGREAANRSSEVLGEVILCVKAPKRTKTASDMPLSL